MKRNIFYVMITILLLLCIAFFSRETVQAQRAGRITVDTEGQRAIEKKHVEQVKAVLQEHHLTNSGVMMTKVIYENGKREYTVKINNRLLQKMTSYEQMQIKNKLENIAFPLPDCSFSYEIMENESIN